jgi:plasmid stability protein
MAKVRTTVTLDEDVFHALKIKAARTGKSDSQVIGELLRRGLGVDDLAELWAKVTPAAQEEGMDLAINELRAMRKESRA